MNWKVFSFAVLVFLTLVVCAQNIIFLHHDLYLDVSRWAESLHPLTYIDLDNLDFSMKISVIAYIGGSSSLDWAVVVSTDWCPIHEWAESMFANYSGYQGRLDYATFNVKYGDNYWAVYLWKKELYNSNLIILFSLLIVCLWIVFAYYTYKETWKEE
jgi:hypothetical protein